MSILLSSFILALSCSALDGWQHGGISQQQDLVTWSEELESRFGITRLMIAAAQAHDPAEIQKLIAEGEDPNAQDRISIYAWVNSDRAPSLDGLLRVVRVREESGERARMRERELGHTALHYAAAFNSNPSILRELLSQGADANEFPFAGLDSLAYASAWNDSAEVITLLQGEGLHVDQISAIGADALELVAAHQDDPEITAAMIESCPDLEPGGGGRDWTLLMHAASSNPNPDCVALWIGVGGELSDTDRYGWTPLLHAAATNPNPRVLQLLLSRGSSVREMAEEGMTVALVASANQQSVEGLKLLHQAGADFGSKTADGWSCLMLAMGANHSPEVVSWLAGRVSDPRVRANSHASALSAGADDYSSSVFHAVRPAHAERWVGNGRSRLLARHQGELLKALLMAYPEVEWSRGQLGHALSCASRAGALEAMRVLLEAGADPFWLYGDLESPVSYAAAHSDSVEAVRLLLAYAGEIPSTPARGITPLHAWVRYCEDLEILTALLDFGFPLEARTERGETPLMEASSFVRAGVIEALLDAGADPHARSDDGRTALHYALQRNASPASALALIRGGADPMALTSEGDSPFQMLLGSERVEPGEDLEELRRLLDPWSRVIPPRSVQMVARAYFDDPPDPGSWTTQLEKGARFWLNEGRRGAELHRIRVSASGDVVEVERRLSVPAMPSQVRSAVLRALGKEASIRDLEVSIERYQVRVLVNGELRVFLVTQDGGCTPVAPEAEED